MPTQDRIPFVAALEALHQQRTDEIVITTMGSAREWPRISSHPLDFHFIPSAMGQAPAIGLGLALAQPQREVVVLNGDGCMLMNLGCLVTIAATDVTNLTLVVMDNSTYEVTGGQQTAAALGAVDFGQMAAAAGWPTTLTCSNLADWRRALGDLSSQPGPRFVLLKVDDVGADFHLEVPGPMPQRIAAFTAALATG